MGLFNLICCGSGQPLSPSHSSHQLAQGIDIKSTPPRERESEYDELIKVTQLLQCLAEVRGSPIEQLQGAVELIADHLDVSLASISVLTEAPVLSSACIAVGGDDAYVMQLGMPLTIVSPDEAEPGAAQTSTHMVLEQKAFISSSVPDSSKDVCPLQLPSDWHVLHKIGGLRSFAAVPIIRGGRILGVLNVASPRGDALDSKGVPAQLEAAATWMSQWVEGGGLLRLSQLVAEVWCAGDVEALIQAVCVGLQDHYKARMQLKLSARVALLAGPNTNSAIIYEEQAPSGLSLSQSSVMLNPGDTEALPSPRPLNKRLSSSDVHAKLKQIRNSTAVSSLEDLRNLTNAIASNDRAHELFTRESQTLMHAPSASALPLGCSPPSTPLAASSALHAGPASGPLHRGSLTSRSYNGFSGANHVLSNDTGLPHSPRLASVGGRGTPASRSVTNINSGCSPADTRLGLTAAAGADRSSANRPGSFVGRPELQRQPSNLSMALSEDVLLRMVHEAEHAAPPSHLVAHSMPSLERTVLAQAMSMPPGERGTWISDVATYMTQPNRPGRDIVVSPRSPPVASLAIACLSGPRPSSNSSSNQKSTLSSSGHRAPSGLTDATEADHVLMGVYLTSGTTLSALQLQAVLRELHLVLGLLSQAVVMRVRGALKDEVNMLVSALLGNGVNTLNSCDSLPLGLCAPSSPMTIGNAGAAIQLGGGSNAGLHMQTSMNGRMNSGLLSSLIGRKKEPPSRHSSEIQGASGPMTWMDLSGQNMSNLACGSASNLKNSIPGSPQCAMQRARSFTIYSRGPVVPQVAPLVSGLQDRMRSLLAARSQAGCFNRHEDLKSVRGEVLIAHGGFGSVFQGLWQGLEVAIKIVPQRMDHSDSVREAVELAVMSTVSHPNILGVQNYWTDVLVTTGTMMPGERRPNGLLKLESGIGQHGMSVDDTILPSALSPGMSPRAASSFSGKASSSGEVKRSLVIVMELCDQGSLDEAIHRGAFRLIIPGKAPRINMLAVLTTLLEIAMALRHMHSMQLVHCDLKPGNVLLKSSLSDVRQFTTKLCDFGLVKFRQEAVDLTEQIRRSTFTGTVTHSPPEMLRGDPNPDFCYDIYALGIVMWELISSQPVYAGLSDRQVAQQVVYNNLRPEFPRGIDPQYRDLAHRCWSADPQERPTSDQVVQALSGMLMSLRERAAAAAQAAANAANAARMAAAPRPAAANGHGHDMAGQKQAHHHGGGNNAFARPAGPTTPQRYSASASGV